MTTEKAFLELIYKEDVLKRTGMTASERSKFRAYYKGMNQNRKPKLTTMEKFLKAYGFTKHPERWYL